MYENVQSITEWLLRVVLNFVKTEKIVSPIWNFVEFWESLNVRGFSLNSYQYNTEGVRWKVSGLRIKKGILCISSICHALLLLSYVSLQIFLCVRAGVHDLIIINVYMKGRHVYLRNFPLGSCKDHHRQLMISYRCIFQFPGEWELINSPSETICFIFSIFILKYWE